MSFLVSIVNYATPSYAAKCVRTLLADSAFGERGSIVVVDNFESDASRTELIEALEFAKGLPFFSLYLVEQNLGYGAAHNRAVSHALASNPALEYVVYLNADCECTLETITRAIAVLQDDPSAAALGPKLLDGNGVQLPSPFHFHFDPQTFRERDGISRAWQRWRSTIAATVSPPPSSRTEVDWISGACIVARQEAVKAVGGFDESFFLYFEDVDLCRRLRQQGYRILFEPSLSVVHHRGASIGAHWDSPTGGRLPAHFYRSQNRYFVKHHGAVGARIAELLRVSLAAGWHVRGALLGKRPPLPAGFLGELLRHSLFRSAARPPALPSPPPGRPLAEPKIGASAEEAARAADAPLAKTSVVIPVRIDTPDRLHNLKLLLTFLRAHTAAEEILILEHGAHETLGEVDGPGIRRFFFKSDGAFHKSRMLNLGVALARCERVLLCDSDILVHPRDLSAASRALDAAPDALIYPFNGLMLQLRRELVSALGSIDQAFVDTLPRPRSFEEITEDERIHWLYGEDDRPTKGAMLLCHREAFLLAGGFHEAIISYGLEDIELYRRLETLGRPIRHLQEAGPAYHLEHRRGADSRYGSLTDSNKSLYLELEALGRDETAAYVANGLRTLRVSTREKLHVIDRKDQFSMQVSPLESLPAEKLSVVFFAPTERDVVEHFPRVHAALCSSFFGLEILLAGGVSRRVYSRMHLDCTVYVDCQFVPHERRLDYALERATGSVILLADAHTEIDVMSLIELITLIERKSSSAAAGAEPPRGTWGEAALDAPILFSKAAYDKLRASSPDGGAHAGGSPGALVASFRASGMSLVSSGRTAAHVP